MRDPHRLVLALACVAAVTAAPAPAQQGQLFPPVPGPFLIAPALPPMPEAPMAAHPAAGPALVFAPPANAMRLPYWMQPDRPGQPGAAPEIAEAPAVTAPDQDARTQQTSVDPGYGRATAPGAFPGYAAPMPWVAAPQPSAGIGPGYGAPAAGWGYATPPGWAVQPYAPAPGWTGWVPPGAGN